MKTAYFPLLTHRNTFDGPFIHRNICAGNLFPYIPFFFLIEKKMIYDYEKFIQIMRTNQASKGRSTWATKISEMIDNSFIFVSYFNVCSSKGKSEWLNFFLELHLVVLFLKFYRAVWFSFGMRFRYQRHRAIVCGCRFFPRAFEIRWICRDYVPFIA